MNYSDVGIFTDDNAVCACDKDVESMARRLEDDILRAVDCFEQNRMAANPKKFK